MNNTMKCCIEKILGVGAYSNVIQFTKFGIVGVVNTLVMLSIYWLLLSINVNEFIAVSLGYCISLVVAFLFNKQWVFKDDGKEIKTMTKFILVYLNSLLLTNVLLYILSTKFGVDRRFAPFIIVAITTVLNYTLNKKWVFAKRNEI